jgi:4-amino-4-deoxy-L-arabinose transferase-like glycosyltransferase
MNRYLVVVILLFVIFSLLYTFIVPPNEAPDEGAHLEYINFIAAKKELSNQFIPDKMAGYEGHHSPLYYVLLGSFVAICSENNRVDINPLANKEHWATKDTKRKSSYVFSGSIFNIFPGLKGAYLFYILRIISILITVINLIYLFKIGTIFFKEKRWLIFYLLFIATLPQFQFISGMINNDNLANLFSTLCIYYSLNILTNQSAPKSSYFKLGIFLGLGTLTKITVLFIMPFLLIEFIYLLWHKSNVGNRKHILYGYAITIIAAVLISGWFLVRNYLIYGDFSGHNVMETTLPEYVTKRSLFSSYFIYYFFPNVFGSFIGKFGWMNILLPTIIYLGYIVLLIVSFGGLILHIKDKKSENSTVYFLVLLISLCLGALIYSNLTFSRDQGRFLFPVISCIGLLFAIGIKSAYECITNKKWANLVLRLILISFIMIDVISLITVHLFYFN